MRIKLSDKGLQLHAQLDKIFQRHSKDIEGMGVGSDELVEMVEALRRVSRFWDRSLFADTALTTAA